YAAWIFSRSNHCLHIVIRDNLKVIATDIKSIPYELRWLNNTLNEWKGLPLDMHLINTCAIMG
ncbi:hypothetical protein ACPVCE_004728, partial [Escherichia coli]